MKLSLAPLQGYTDFPLRNAMHQHLGGVDNFYSPFLRLENDKTLKSKYLKDIHPDNNIGIPLVPQILVNSAADFLQLAQLITDFGYNEVNWNLGCPYPMVAKRKLGSGLIPYPDEIRDILENVLPKIKLNISIKIRTGYESPTEILGVLNAIKHLPLAEIILHPRLGKQVYKGQAELSYFLEANKGYKLAYNGDIVSRDGFLQLKHELPNVEHFMIGRGLLANPFLAQEIKSGMLLTTFEKKLKFELLHEYLWEHFNRSLSGDSHVLNKMLSFWEYFALLFEVPKKVYKSIKKCKNAHQYIATYQYILNDHSFKGMQ
jgi:tRNA-dihydrouridine synthase